MIHHLTFADERMTTSADHCVDSGHKYGLKTIVYSPNMLSQHFWFRNSHILRQQRGAGYWLWKPYFIDKVLSEEWVGVGDWVLYTDAGVGIIHDPRILTDFEEDIILFGNHYSHTHWCKGDVIRAMIGQCDGSVLQVQASAMMFRACKKSYDFVNEWLLWSQIPGFIDDSPSKWPDHPGFQEHRHDQAILTCLAEKYGIKRHWWPAVYNDGAFTYDKGTYTDSYPPIFHHHRKRNDEW